MFFCLIQCQNKSFDKPPILESLLDNYISEGMVDKGCSVLVIETKGWSDTTSIIRILSTEKENIILKNIYKAKYKGIDIYFEYRVFKSIGSGEVLSISKTQEAISNNLNWKRVTLKSSVKKNDDHVFFEHFNEIQFLYHSKRKCIFRMDYLVNKQINQIVSPCFECKTHARTNITN